MLIVSRNCILSTGVHLAKICDALKQSIKVATLVS